MVNRLVINGLLQMELKGGVLCRVVTQPGIPRKPAGSINPRKTWKTLFMENMLFLFLSYKFCFFKEWRFKTDKNEFAR